MLYASGLRVSELAGLSLDTVELATGSGEMGSVRVIGKGSKERVVPLGSFAVKAVSRYLERRDELCDGKTGAIDPRALFLSRRGKRLGVRQVQSLVHKYGALGAGGPTSTRTRSATPARRTCSTAAPICAPSRRCSATPAFRRRSGTPTSRSIT